MYWAGQRLTTIRYFLVVYGIFIASRVQLQEHLTNQDNELTILLISFSALMITIAFWILDYRNATLVESAEHAMDVLERALASKLGFCAIRMALAGKRPAYPITQYRFVMLGVFLVCTAIVSIIVVCDAYKVVQYFSSV